MRILLDPKDLIDLIDFNRPVDLATLDAWLKRQDGTLLLSHSNVSHFVGRVFNAADFLTMRVPPQRLASLPSTYIREGSIIRDELSLALEAYQGGHEPSSVNPYVSRWDKTAHWEGEPATKMLVGLRLDEVKYRRATKRNAVN